MRPTCAFGRVAAQIKRAARARADRRVSRSSNCAPTRKCGTRARPPKLLACARAPAPSHLHAAGLRAPDVLLPAGCCNERPRDRQKGEDERRSIFRCCREQSSALLEAIWERARCASAFLRHANGGGGGGDGGGGGGGDDDDDELHALTI